MLNEVTKMWGSNNCHDVTEHNRNSPELNMICSFPKQNVISPS